MIDMATAFCMREGTTQTVTSNLYQVLSPSEKRSKIDNDIQDGKERVDKHYTTFSDLSSVVRRMKLYDSGDPQTLRLSHSRRIRPSIRP